MTRTVTVTVYDADDREYRVTCDVTPGYPATRDEPGEGPEVEITLVRDGLGALGAMDADRLCSLYLDEIEMAAVELAEDSDAAEYEDHCDAEREFRREDA